MTTYNIDWGQIGIGLAVLVTAFLQKWDSLKVKKALEAESARRELSARLRDAKLDEIHGAVNGNMADQKRATMILARRIAELTKNPADIIIAKEAEIDFMNHQAQTNPPQKNNEKTP